MGKLRLTLVVMIMAHSSVNAEVNNDLSHSSTSFTRANSKPISQVSGPQRNPSATYPHSSYADPRGDYHGGGGGGYGNGGGGYGGGGHGWGGGGYGGGGWGGGGWGPIQVYHEDDVGLEKGLLGLLGLTGLSGLKGLLGLAALSKLLLPLLLLLLPLLLPLLALKALLSLALLLLIPVPVVTNTGRRNSAETDKLGNPKLLSQDSIAEFMGKFPSDLNHIMGKIKESEWFKGVSHSPSKRREPKSLEIDDSRTSSDSLGSRKTVNEISASETKKPIPINATSASN